MIKSLSFLAASSVWSCTLTNLTQPSKFCASTSISPFVCTDDGVFNDNQRTASHYRKQLSQCSTAKKRANVCPNTPSLCHLNVLNKTTYCGGNDQVCQSSQFASLPRSQSSSQCLSYCYTDCYPCNSKDNCDLLVGFGILADVNNQSCFSLEQSGAGLLTRPALFKWLQ